MTFHFLQPRPTRPAVRRSREAGFSLPELMVVVAIIMLLATLAVPRYRQAKQQAEDAAARATLNGIHTAEEAHRITHGEYADSFTTLAGEGGAPVVPDGADAADGPSGSVMVFHGYIYRLSRPQPDEYTVIAEPIADRDRRPRYIMDQLGTVLMTGRGTTNVGGGGTEPPN